ncbi:hypothetical protein [Colwellia echini]|uniref:Alginate export domain-containing protein n=1 Tax=Colwellia echini TaxID=1982103 RepID=A0ABY3MYI0_9GAMM|nr:hypothetical protein [Colwellia echini]TYK66290.1 hypothetical protein CWS31_006770 [Colwellia echini]
MVFKSAATFLALNIAINMVFNLAMPTAFAEQIEEKTAEPVESVVGATVAEAVGVTGSDTVAKTTEKQTNDKAAVQSQASKTGIVPAHLLCGDGIVKAARQRPGRAVDEYQLTPCNDDERISPWTETIALGPVVEDRWGIVESLGLETNLWDPYNGQNPLKGDIPVWGKDWFYNIIAISDTVIENRNFPIPVGNATTSKPNSLDTIANGNGSVFSQSFVVEQVVYKGDTVFRPPDYEFRLTAVFNFNQVEFDERGILNIDPSVGSDNGTKRTDKFVGIQAAFFDKHLRNVSHRFDFDSIRIGIQPFSSDFRGFLFQDSQLGIRLFGNRSNNVFQYNIAWFRRLEKDTNSGLNDVTKPLRNDDVFTANLYWQDFPVKGFVSQASVTYNRNREKGQIEYDTNGFITRPASLFEERFSRDYDVTYLGYSGDGHFGRVNVTGSAYYALGEQTDARYRDATDEVNAYFLATELSLDVDWFRPKLSLLLASGDDDPYDGVAKGFDAIFENPQFAGADTSFFIRQTVPLIGGGGVALSGRNGILPSLRSSKEQGQSNFINPGLRLIGLGFDADILPELKVSMNLNQLWFDDISVLETLRQQGNIDKNLGQDLSAALIWRPFQSQNVVVRFSAAALISGSGFDQLYGSDYGTPYSILTNIILAY